MMIKSILSDHSETHYKLLFLVLYLNVSIHKKCFKYIFMNNLLFLYYACVKASLPFFISNTLQLLILVFAEKSILSKGFFYISLTVVNLF